MCVFVHLYSFHEPMKLSCPPFFVVTAVLTPNSVFPVKACSYFLFRAMPFLHLSLSVSSLCHMPVPVSLMSFHVSASLCMCVSFPHSTFLTFHFSTLCSSHTCLICSSLTRVVSWFAHFIWHRSIFSFLSALHLFTHPFCIRLSLP